MAESRKLESRHGWAVREISRELIRVELVRRLATYPEPTVMRVHEAKTHVMDVVEIIAEWGHPLLRKLMWCRPPFEDVEACGFANYLFHANYCANDPEGFVKKPDAEWSLLESARYRVRKLFNEHYLALADQCAADGKPFLIAEALPPPEEPGQKTWRDRAPLL